MDEQEDFLNHCGSDRSALNNNEHEAEQQKERPRQSRMTQCISRLTRHLSLKRHVHYLPILTVILIIAAFFTTYGVSVSQGHVEPVFPYISHTGVKIPERGIFGQLINIGALLMGANVYVRFLQQTTGQRELYSSHPKGRRLVIASLFCGCLAALGMSVAANFEARVMRVPHLVGMILAIVMGLAYCWLQTSISLCQCPRGCVTIGQLVISIVLSLFFIIAAVSRAIYLDKKGRGEGTKEVELRGVYLVSTISQWLMFITLVSFVLTFCPDFSTLTLQGPRVRFSASTTNRRDNTAQFHAASAIELQE